MVAAVGNYWRDPKGASLGATILLAALYLLVGLSLAGTHSQVPMPGSLRFVSNEDLLNIAAMLLLPAALLWVALRHRAWWLTICTAAVCGLLLTVALMRQDPAPQLSTGFLFGDIYLGLFAVAAIVGMAVVRKHYSAHSELKRSMHDMQGAMEQVSSEDRAKGEFLSVLAHELRNPLSPIVSCLELVKMKMMQERRLDVLQHIDIAMNHLLTMSHLLDDMLDISRISRGKIILAREPVELQKVVASALQSVDTLLKSRGHTRSVVVPGKPVRVVADPVRIEQILVNLLSNAAKYTEPGGMVSLTFVYDPARGVRFSVRDNGIGLRPDMLEHIFDPFAQVQEKSAGTGAGKGLGIGLSLVRTLVELHGGEIWAQSAGEGKGSEFIVVMPLFDIGAAEPPQEHNQGRFSPARRGRRRRSTTVLIVDDNADAAQSLKELLSQESRTILIAPNGVSAVMQMEDMGADVVLLDIGLPDQSGYDVAREMRKRFGRRPLLIALTGYGQEGDKAKATEAGFDHHLTKPVSINDVEPLLQR